MSAGEIRKRIAQYYQESEHENELRFELPLGSYTPVFLLPRHEAAVPLERPLSGSATQPVSFLAETSGDEESAPPEPTATVLEVLSANAETPAPRRWSRLVLSLVGVGLLGATILTVLLVTNLRREQEAQTGLSYFWGPLLLSKQDALIVIGVHSFDRNGQDLSPTSELSSPAGPQSMLTAMTHSDMVSMSDLKGYSQIIDLLSRSGHTYRTQGSSETTLEQLRGGPSFLLGGFNNI